MKKTLFTAALGAMAISAGAQQITETDLKDIQSSFVMDASTKALQNIITNDANLRKLSLNRDIQGETDHYFKYKVDVKGITDQQQSGRCWMFTSMNVLRPSVMKQFNIKEFDFSHNYNYFWDMFEKSNLFLENAIATAGHDMLERDVEFYFRTPVGDGGVWNLFYNIAEKYGVVPQNIMPETAHSNNTTQMRSVLNECLRTGGYELRTMVNSKKSKKEITEAKKNILKDVYRILSLCLGNPPSQFEWRYETSDGEIKTLKTTPKEFYNMIKPENYNPESYVMIMNDPTREYYKVYEIANYRNTYEGVNWVYLNLPNDVIKKAAISSIKANEAMYASCDVAMYNSADGVCHPEMFDYSSLFGVKLDMDKKARILTRESASAHAMTLMAVDTDENDQPLKWQFENSWGPTAGHNGYMTFTDKWFDEYMFRIVINKKYLDDESSKAAKQKPITLPAWDYMF
ncbi:C1 family peptidase [Bacteroides caecigallinarum]|uniref:aminopeptidase C n=1 Tax=Bacteroides caecigallinarum TaxID=1411144 RepID=UPI00195F20B0|nr:C1 family peptidase [Bacteroides caecigallinarum]MBM6881741.1 C1 family peptidase [Bacteroides caecigallinarum]MCF2553048.1 C1 family peptidase [Bacteroides caecigallinarum]